MISETLKAWAAGIFDGEGSALIERRKNGYFQIFVSVVNKDKKILDQFTEHWGAIYHGHDTMVWLEKDKAITFLIDVIPFLISKQDQAIIVLKALFALRSTGAFGTSHKRVGKEGCSKIVEPYWTELRRVFIPTKGKQGPNKAGTLI